MPVRLYITYSYLQIYAIRSNPLSLQSNEPLRLIKRLIKRLIRRVKFKVQHNDKYVEEIIIVRIFGDYGRMLGKGDNQSGGKKH